MTKKELKQKMYVYISTMKNLNGKKPSVSEMYRALGSEYEAVLAEYLNNGKVFAGVA